MAIKPFYYCHFPCQLTCSSSEKATSSSSACSWYAAAGGSCR
jgi:hypothetical protein